MSAPTIQKSDSLPTILIAGGAGFLGARLAEKLLKTQCRVVVVDNLTTGKKSLLQPLLSHPRFLFVEANINQELPPEVGSVNYIFHLAASELYLAGRRDVSLDALLTNALGTKNLLSLAKKSGAKFLLASSIDVYQGLLSSENLKNYFGATTAQERQFSHAEAKRFAEALVWESFEKDKIDARIVRLGEIYGPQMDLSSAGTLGRLLKDLFAKKDLTVYGEGLEKEYYAHVTDVVEGLIKATFQKGTEGKIYLLTNLPPTTPLELVYLLKELSGKDLRVLFKPPLTTAPLPESKIPDGDSQPELGWRPKISLREGLKEVLTEGRVGVVAPPKDVKLHATKKISVKKPTLNIPKVRFAKSITVLFFAAVLWFLIYPTAGMFFNLYRSQKELQNFQQSTANINLPAAGAQAEDLGRHLTASNRHLERLSWLFTALGKSRQKKAFANLATSATLLSNALGYEIKGTEPLVGTLLNLTSKDTERTSAPDTAQARANLIRAQEEILLAEAYFKNVDHKSLGKRVQEKAALLGEGISALKELTPTLQNATASLPQIFGFTTPQTYLLVFQNSNELRPTGGFIGSYGKLVLKNGRIDQLLVDDVYNIDGVLEAKDIAIAPPAPLGEHLGVSRWLMRDANWDPDFSATAKQLKTFYNLATGETVAGVAALDLEVIKEILELTGPIYLAQFNESIGSDNFFEKTEFYSEANYFEGSPQKKAFLSLLSARLLEKALQFAPKDMVSAARIVNKSLQERHLLVYYPQDSLASLLAQKFYDGALRTFGGDYLMVVDANVGATKANYYVKRSLNYAVRNTDRQGLREGQLTITYVHGAASNTWPGGAYKNYLRVYTSYGTVLEKVERSTEGVDGKALEITQEVDQTNENGKTVFGTVFTLDAGKSLSLTFTYKLPPIPAPGPSSKAYELLVQKQPGTVADPLIVDFLTPFGHEVKSAPEGAKRVGNLWRWSGNLREDRELNFLLE